MSPSDKLHKLTQLAEMCVDLIQENNEHYAEVSPCSNVYSVLCPVRRCFRIVCQYLHVNGCAVLCECVHLFAWSYPIPEWYFLSFPCNLSILFRCRNRWLIWSPFRCLLCLIYVVSIRIQSTRNTHNSSFYPWNLFSTNCNSALEFISEQSK